MQTNRLLWLMALCSSLMLSCNDDSKNPPTPDAGTEGGGTPIDVFDPEDNDPPPDTTDDNPPIVIVDITDDGISKDDEIDVDSESVSCDDICEIGVHRCTESGSQICELVNSCPVWGAITSCANCNEDTGECRAECPKTCTEGDKKCEGNEVWSCVAGEDSCMQWEMTESCGDDKYCSEAFTCVPGCKDVCTENDTRCANNSMQKCIANAQGCLTWQIEKACETGKICDAGGTQCEYACGDDCDPFSIILIPDTQYYTQSYRQGATTADGKKINKDTSLMTQQMNWIINKKEEMNTRFVIHLGDITNLNVKEEWVHGKYAMDLLAKKGIPFTISTGNHDYVKRVPDEKGDLHYIYYPPRSGTLFPEYFNDKNLEAFFKGTALADMKWFSGYHLGANSYGTFSVGKLHFLVLALEFFPRKDVIAWADSVLNDPKFADYHVIVETHAYLSVGAKYCGLTTIADTHGLVHGLGAQSLFNEFIQRHSNIIMVVSGHVSDSEYTTHNNLFGTPVHEILVDYQSESPCQKQKKGNDSVCKAGTCQGGLTNSGNGWLRQLIIDPKTGHVTGKTHSVIGEDKYSYGTDNPKPHLFCNKQFVSDSKYNRYSSDASSADHSNDFSFNITPPRHQYSDKDIYAFAPRNINKQGSGDQLTPTVAMNRSNGSFVVAWEDNSCTSDGTFKGTDGKEQNNFDIAFRLFNKGGYANGDQKYVTSNNKVAKGNQITPDIAMDGKGNFVIVWADDSNNDNSYEIRMAGFDSKGKSLFSDVRVSESTANQTNPRIAMASDGRFVVVWNEKAGNAHIHAQMRSFSADGKATGETKYIIGQTEGTRRNPDVAMDANGNYVIAWDDDDDNNGIYQIQVQKYDFSGNALSEIISVSKSEGRQLKAAVGMNAKGAFYVAYRDDRVTSGKFAIRVRGWDENLKEIMPDTEFYSENHNNSQATVCVDDAGNAVVGLYDPSLRYKDDKKNYEDVPGDVIMGTIMGGKIGKIISSSIVVWNNQKFPSIDCTGDGHVVVVYADDADDNKSYEVFGRGFNTLEEIK